MNEKIIKQLIDLRKQQKDLEAEKLLMENVEKDPKNTDLLLRLAIVEMYSPFADYDKSIECLSKIFSYDPNNIKAILLLLHINRLKGYMDEELIHKLTSVNSEDNELQSMLELAKAWYYQKNENYKMYEMYLLKSIELCQKHVWNNIELARLYIKQGKIIEGRKLLLKGLENIQRTDNGSCDTSDIENFLTEFYTGTDTTESVYNSIQEDLMES